jgi:hypothetical protein
VSTDPPAEFGAAFLSWLREATEAAWQHVDEWTVDDDESRGYIGPRWRPPAGDARSGGPCPVRRGDRLAPRRLEMAPGWTFAGTDPGPRAPVRRRRRLAWILSIVGADAIVYGEGLRAYLLTRLGGILG